MYTTGGIVVKGLALGDGRAKICVPLTAKQPGGLLEQAAGAVQAGAQVLEWRFDMLENAGEAAIGPVLNALHAVAGDIPLLFTLRTAPEGGKSTADAQQAAELVCRALDLGLVDMVDAEYAWGETALGTIFAEAAKWSVPVVVSSHHFGTCPLPQEMLRYLVDMRAAGEAAGYAGVIPKLAVMPNSHSDTLALMQASRRFVDATGGPVITMAMGALGAASRVCGFLSGTALTFASYGEASAPGQLPIEDLRTVLELLAKAQDGADKGEVGNDAVWPDR